MIQWHTNRVRTGLIVAAMTARRCTDLETSARQQVVLKRSEQAERLATKADLSDLRADLNHALWLQTGAIVAAMAGLLAIVQVMVLK